MGPRRKISDLKLKSIWDETLLYNYLKTHGTTTKHATKIWNWMIAHPQKDLHEVPMESWCVPRQVIEGIRRDFVKYTTSIVDKHGSARGDTIKLLIELQDGGHRVEAVLIKHVQHVTVCISSQIGCQMGCKFCATGTMGIIGDLTSAEIIEQLVHANSIWKIRNVVFMGMGEPLNNYENMKLAVEFMIDNKRFGLSPRHVTVSTVGVIKNIYRLTQDMPAINLALSLHAPNQELRVKIVPTASAYRLTDLMTSIDNHIQQNNRIHKKGNSTSTLHSDDGELENNRDFNDNNNNEKDSKKKIFSKLRAANIMIEYILIKNVNDRDEHAHELAQLLYPRRQSILLNLIPYNPTDVPEAYEAPTSEQVQRFFSICTSNEYGIFTRIRQEMGQDIAGACGQLALVTPASSKTDVSDIEDLTSTSTSSLKGGGSDHSNQYVSNTPNMIQTAFVSVLHHIQMKIRSAGYIGNANYYLSVSSIGILFVSFGVWKGFFGRRHISNFFR